jgi:hypothetical protein
MGRTATTTWSFVCDQCGKDGGEIVAEKAYKDSPPPDGWVEMGKLFCSEECYIEDARQWYREVAEKATRTAA